MLPLGGAGCDQKGGRYRAHCEAADAHSPGTEGANTTAETAGKTGKNYIRKYTDSGAADTGSTSRFQRTTGLDLGGTSMGEIDSTITAEDGENGKEKEPANRADIELQESAELMGLLQRLVRQTAGEVRAP